MILRWAAVAAWLLAAFFVNVVSPALVSPEVTQVIEGRATQTVHAEVLEIPKPQNGFQGSERYSTTIRISSIGALEGCNGSISGEEVAEFQVGSKIHAVVSFRPAFRVDEDFSSSLKHLVSHEKPGTMQPVAFVRASFLNNLQGITPDSAGLVAGMTIGDDSKLSADVLEDMKVVSLTHLSAVSGTNCAIVLAGTALLFSLLPLRRSIRIGLSLAVIFAYLTLVGPEPSVLRASMMVGIVLLGILLGRRVPPLESLSLAVVVLLIYKPTLSMDFGFALSALATLGLLVLAPKFVELLGKRMPNWLAIVISVSLSAQIACLPVLLILQPSIPLYSVVANILAEPLVAPITVIGLIACLIAPVIPAVAVGLCFIASVPAAFILFIAERFAAAPSASINWVAGGLGISLAFLLVLCIWFYVSSELKHVKRIAGLIAALLMLSLFAQSSSLAVQRSDFYRGDYSIINCDVGQGDALVIRSQGEVAVIDVGRESQAVDSCLTDLGITKIDLLVLTHYDFDHVGGVSGAVVGREVTTALVTSFSDNRPGANFAQDVLLAQGISFVEAEKDMRGSIGKFDWQVLSPHRGAPEAEDTNDASTSMYWSSPNVVLFTLADLGERAQLRIGAEYGSLLQSGFDSRMVIVKVAHHGSGDQAPEFYEAISADIALVSVGADNSYGHPTKRTLDLLGYTGTQVLRTDEMGAIGISDTDAGLEVSIAGRS